MTPVRVVTDSGCDLPPEVLEKWGIVVVPLNVRIGQNQFLDTDLTAGEFWEQVEEARNQGSFPQTSQPSPGQFEEVFEPIVNDGNEVVCVTITSKHSGTFNSALVAAQRFGEAVRVFDSWSASIGTGFMAVAAARAAGEGADLNEILAILEGMPERTHLSVVFHTIEYIRMGGRADALIPVLSRAMRFLKIKPIISFVEGELKLRGQGRTFAAALKKVEQQVLGFRPFEYLGVMHTRRPDEAQATAERVRRMANFVGPILIGEVGSALSSHTGPRVIGVVGVARA